MSREQVAKAVSLVRDAIEIDLGSGGKSAARLGGAPDLPSASAWPRGKHGPLEFVAQIPLEEIAPLDVHDRLPAAGLLSFFVGHGVDEETGELKTEAAVLHLPPDEALSPQKPPKGVPKRKAQALALRPRALLPPYGSRLYQGAEVDARYKAVYDELYDVGGLTVFHGMLCFDRPYEARLGPDDVILLRLEHDEGVPYDFAAFAIAYFVISKQDLAARRWGAARVVEGATI